VNTPRFSEIGFSEYNFYILKSSLQMNEKYSKILWMLKRKAFNLLGMDPSYIVLWMNVT